MYLAVCLQLHAEIKGLFLSHAKTDDCFFWRVNEFGNAVSECEVKHMEAVSVRPQGTL